MCNADVQDGCLLSNFVGYFLSHSGVRPLPPVFRSPSSSHNKVPAFFKPASNIIPTMASNSGIPVSHSQLLPTQQNLSELLVKLLTVFGIESVLDGEVLPRQPLQREIGKNLRPALRPMVGNDFHIQTAFGTDHSWKALLQLDQGDDSTKISLPLCHVAQHPGTDDAAAAIRLVEHMAKLLRYTWPDANVGALSKRRQLGPPFVDSDGTDYHLFRWLASKDLNPVSEGVFLRNLYQSVDLLYQPLRQKSVRSSFL